MTKGYWAAVVVGAALIILAVFSVTHQAKAPTVSGGGVTATSTAATSTPVTTTSTAPKTVIHAGSGATATSSAPKVVYTGPFPINAKDKIASWSFTGAYTNNATGTTQADTDITHLKSLLNKGEYDNYDLYNGIGNDYVLLGNGSAAYDAYNNAAKADPGKGLVYTNLASLFQQLGAYYTAADAYAKAVQVEPGMLEYQVERVKYLTTQLPKETALIQAAIAAAYKQFGDTAAILTVEAQWLEGQGNYTEAIKAWQRAKFLMPGQDTSAIDAAIARDQAKLQQQ